MRYITQILVTLSVMGLTGCATNPVTGRHQLSIVPESTVISQAVAQYDGQMNQYRAHGKIVTDPAVVKRVQAITERLVQQAMAYREDTRNWNWEVQIIDDPIANAFCAAGGKMAIFTGLLRGLDLTDDELAQVMAHEVSHALLSHGAEDASISLVAQILVAAVAATGRTAYDQDMLRLGADVTTSLAWTLPNSRGEETEADAVGIEIAAKAGYDPNAAVTMQQKLAAHYGTSNSRFDWFSTHPGSVKRIEALSARVDSMDQVYMASLDGRAQRSVVPQASTPLLAATGTPLAMPTDGCNSASLVDRAACSGQLRVGMHKYDVIRALGSPNEQDATGAVLRYEDRYLQLDATDNLVRILHQRP
jgi:predicted Zn-dependent protease